MTHGLLISYVDWNADHFGILFMWAIAFQVLITCAALMGTLK